MVAAPVIGSTVILVLYVIRDVFVSQIGPYDPAVDWNSYLRYFEIDSVFFLIPALLVHLWLPLFGLSVLVTKVIQLLMSTVGVARWFIEGGQDHPLQAVGFVATAIVFAAGAILHWWP
jgi:hypothetical protein